MSASLPTDHPRSEPDPASYRDPGSRVFERGGEVFRAVGQRALEDFERLRTSRFFEEAVTDGRLIATELVEGIDAPEGVEASAVLRHSRIPVVSYPYEWTFSMLREAALLQLDLLIAAIDEDLILKDSTPYNVQFRGAQPTFIDIGSFERLGPGDVWLGYRQFLRQYLYPLMMTAHVGIPFQPWLRGRLEGPTADEMRRMLSGRDVFRKSTLLHVALPSRAERRYDDEGAARDVRAELKEAGFTKDMIRANVQSLHRVVEQLAWDPGGSTWHDYSSRCDHVPLQRECKADFVTRSILQHAPAVVWDVGTNDGHFARLAAVTSDYVVALDSDHAVLDQLYQTLRSEGTRNVLPLIQDLADPSPSLGWRGAERPPLLDRSTPNLVLCLAVIHHLVIGRNVPLRDVMDWLADLGSHVVLEFVPPDDPMVKTLTANKRPHEIHRDYTESDLRRYMADRFDVTAEADVPAGGRRLFALSPRT